MTAGKNSNNLSEALFLISGKCFGAAFGIGTAELIKNSSNVTEISGKVFPKLQKRRIT